jgi:hypothetical protein
MLRTIILQVELALFNRQLMGDTTTTTSMGREEFIKCRGPQ